MSALFILVIVLGLGVAVISGVVRSIRERRLLNAPPEPETLPYAPAIRAAPTGAVDVTTLRIGIDGRASKFVRTELEAIAKTYADNTAETRARKLREVSVMLRRVHDSWVYGGADNEPMRDHEAAIAQFTRHVEQARTRVRAGGSAVAPPTSPTGQPVTMILVSVVVCARGELMTITDGATGEDLRRALESAAYRAPDEILAVEIVWIPDNATEQLSSIDLESVYRPTELHPLQGVEVGKVFCTFCGGPFPAELVSCPHCGGPAPGRERPAT